MRRGEVLLGCCYAAVLLWVNAYVCRNWFFHPTAQMNSLDGYWAAIARLGEGWLHLSWWPFWDFGIPFEFTSAPLVPALTTVIAAWRHLPQTMAVQFVSGIFYCAAPVALFLTAWLLTRAPGYSFFAGLFYSLLSPAQILAPDNRLAWAPFLSPHRFLLQAVWDETPRCAALAFLLLFVLFLVRSLDKPRLPDFAAAAIFLALSMLASPFAAVSGALAILCLLTALQTRNWRADLVHALGIGLLGYAVAARFLPPSFWWALGAASAAHEAWSFGALKMIAGAVVIWLILVHALDRWTKDWHIRFFVLLAFAMSCGPVVLAWFDRTILPQADRFRIEMEAAWALAIVFGLRPVVERLPRPLRAVIVLACLWPAYQQIVGHRRIAKDVLFPADVTKTIEYRTAQRVAHEIPGARVMLPGSIAHWANAFTDTPQFSGSEGTVAYSQVQQSAMTAVYNGDTKPLKAYGAAAVAVSGSGSQEYWKPYAYPEKFDALPVLWSEDGVTVYRVPQRSSSLAHVMPESALVRAGDAAALDRYNAALDDPTLPEATFAWQGRNDMRVRALTTPGQAISIQVSWHPGWHAVVNGRPAAVRRDGLGLIWLRPEQPGAAAIEMHYDGGWELRFCRWLSVAGILAAGYCLVRGVLR